MHIVDFQPTKIRVGRWPVSVDVECVAEHSDYGIAATFYTNRLDTVPGHSPVVEIRERDGTIKVFVFKYDEHCPIREYWAEATLIWTNMPNELIAGGELAAEQPCHVYTGLDEER